ncbi:MAG: hypothetical protein CMH38_12965 [Microbacterium sp.]|nr:hypothetical protein [Microbacterium sp.]
MPEVESFRPAAFSPSDMVRKSIPIACRAARMFCATCVFVMPAGLPRTLSVSIVENYNAMLDSASAILYGGMNHISRR